MAGGGSIEERKNKNGNISYRLVYSMGLDAAGKQIKKYKTVKCKNKTEAKKLLREFIMEAEKNIEQGIEPSKKKFGDYVEKVWSEFAEEKLSKNTLATYRIHLKNSITPFFENTIISKVRADHIDTYIKELKKSKRKDGKEGALSSATIQFHYRVIRSVMTYAFKKGHITVNPCDRAETPKVEHEPISIYDEQEMVELLQLLKSEVQHWYLFIKLALFTGMRRNELLALQWKNVDFKNNIINVRHSVQYTKQDKHELKEPKTKSSIRDISIDPELMDELKKYKTIRSQEKLKLGDKWQGGNYNFVFSTVDGKPFYPSVPGAWWRRFIKRNKFKQIRLHELRHSHACFLISKKVPLVVISKRMGHAKTSTTADIYVHYIKEADTEAGNLFGELSKKTNWGN
ncbi:site-specific integrase [Arthrobacter citreus]|nr:site-specific integrase [Arthrobacter citreus]